MNKIFTLFFLLLYFIPTVAQREVMTINSDWTFRFSHQVEKGTEIRVDLPHTWNAQDALSAKPDYKRGIGNYTRKLPINKSWQGKRIFIKFNGANSVADIFLNGKHVGEHKGGYTAFAFELTEMIDWENDNILLVRVNNSENLDVMPLVGDFNFYGGLYRDVEMIITEPVSFSVMDYASSGIYLEQESVSEERALVNVKAILSSSLEYIEKVKLKIRLLDGDKEIYVTEKKIKLNMKSHQQETIPLVIEKPHLWNGKEDPFMYDVELSLWIDGRKVDELLQTMGLRFFSVDSQKGFFLNGKHLPLHGVCRHQERAEIGNALRKEHNDEDIDIMNEMGANAIRLSHYPQDQYFCDLLDKYGYVVWTEIPFVGPGGYMDKGYVDKNSFRENGKQQLIELIRQYYNHPSICFWGLFNELKESGDNPVEYIKELNNLAHQEDKTRLTTSASNQDGNLNFITDLIAWNKYDGWYGSTTETLAKWLDITHKDYPDIKIGISEYGAGASIYQQQDSLVQTIPNSLWHPENWQTHYHMRNWETICNRSFIWGTFVWNMFDFGAAHRKEGDRFGINDKGLVTHDRKIRKDAFYYYKANWNKENPMVYISGKRNNIREKVECDVMIFTNQEEISFFLNGSEVGRKKPDKYGVCIFRIRLQKGKNILQAKSLSLSDTCIWYKN